MENKDESENEIIDNDERDFPEDDEYEDFN